MAISRDTSTHQSKRETLIIMFWSRSEPLFYLSKVASFASLSVYVIHPRSEDSVNFSESKPISYPLDLRLESYSQSICSNLTIPSLASTVFYHSLRQSLMDQSLIFKTFSELRVLTMLRHVLVSAGRKFGHWFRTRYSDGGNIQRWSGKVKRRWQEARIGK